MAETDYAWEILSAALVKGEAVPSYANVYVSLHSANPTATGDWSGELTGTGYVRKYLALTNSPAPYTNTDQIVWVVGSLWSTITHIAVGDSSQGGNMLLYNSITDITNPNTGTTIRIPIGNLTVL
jgi:hypothetical protein